MLISSGPNAVGSGPDEDKSTLSACCMFGEGKEKSSGVAPSAARPKRNRRRDVATRSTRHHRRDVVARSTRHYRRDVAARSTRLRRCDVAARSTRHRRRDVAARSTRHYRRDVVARSTSRRVAASPTRHRHHSPSRRRPPRDCCRPTFVNATPSRILLHLRSQRNPFPDSNTTNSFTERRPQRRDHFGGLG